MIQQFLSLQVLDNAGDEGVLGLVAQLPHHVGGHEQGRVRVLGEVQPRQLLQLLVVGIQRMSFIAIGIQILFKKERRLRYLFKR
jgi:hypothetical protein